MSKPTLADQLGNTLPVLSSTARTAFIASHFILAMGSGAVIMYFIATKLAGSLPPWTCYVLAWLGSLVWYRAVENPLRKFILFAWAYRLADKDDAAKLSDNMKRTGKASWHVTVLLLVATLSLSLFVNFDISEAVTTEQDSTAEIGQANALTTSYDRDVEVFRQAVADAAATDAANLAAAQQDAARWLETARNSKGAKMRGLARKGNGWAQQQLSPAIRRATKRGEDHVAAARAGAIEPAARAELSAYITRASVGRDTVQALTAGIVRTRQDAYAGTLSRRNIMLFVAVLIVLVVFVYTARLLVLACLETGEDLEDDPGEGVAKVASKMMGKANAKLGSMLSEKFGDKLVVAPVGAAPIAPVATPPTAPVAPSLPVAPLVAKPAAPVVGHDFEAVAASCSPEDVRRYKDQFRHNQTRQHTSATATKRAECRDKFLRAKGVLRALGYSIVDSKTTYRKTHNIDGKPCVVTFKKFTWKA